MTLGMQNFGTGLHLEEKTGKNRPQQLKGPLLFLAAVGWDYKELWSIQLRLFFAFTLPFHAWLLTLRCHCLGTASSY